MEMTYKQTFIYSFVNMINSNGGYSINEARINMVLDAHAQQKETMLPEPHVAGDGLEKSLIQITKSFLKVEFQKKPSLALTHWVNEFIGNHLFTMNQTTSNNCQLEGRNKRVNNRAMMTSKNFEDKIVGSSR